MFSALKGQCLDRGVIFSLKISATSTSLRFANSSADAFANAGGDVFANDIGKPEFVEVPTQLVSKELKKRWSYFIRKVYETDPLVCPK